MGKEEIYLFSVSMGNFGIFKKFSTFHKTFGKIAELDWLPERQKG